jgi:hypothetical protein
MSREPENPLAVEIKQEMAVSYFAACRKMVDALEALKLFDTRQGSPRPNSNPDVGRLELLSRARERVFYVVIQREAMKLTNLEGFFETYEIPDEIRTCLGPA